MRKSGKRNIVLGAVLALAALARPARSAEVVADADLKRLDLQRYWSLTLPLEERELVSRVVLVDDALYALTSSNRAFAVHAWTGIIRWANPVAEEGQAVRGPTHAAQYVLFTAPGSVRVMSRQSGQLAGQPRALRGVVIEVTRDTATVSVGEDHGVSIGNLLGVYRTNELGELEGEPIARLRVTSVRPRSSRGDLVRLESGLASRPGDRVMADVVVPLAEVKLPFAASSAAVSDGQSLFVGAANGRFYCLDILSGLQQWQLLTPETVSSTPVLHRGNIYLAGQDGMVISCTKAEKAKNWTSMTEGAVFADLVLGPAGLFVASSDRSLYCLDRHSGNRLWRERFDTPLQVPPAPAGERVYQQVPEHGLYALDTKTGTRMWQRPEGGQFLAEIEADAYLLSADLPRGLVRVNAKNGQRKDVAEAGTVQFAVASQEEASIFLGTPGGELVCLRSRKAPRLRPEQLEMALRDDGKIEAAARLEQAAKQADAAKKPTAPEAPRPAGLFEDDDGLASRSTARPVGGHGVLKLEPSKPAAGTRKDDEKPAEESAEDAEAPAGEQAEAEEPAAAEEAPAEKQTEKEAEKPEAEEGSEEEDSESAEKDDDGG